MTEAKTNHARVSGWRAGGRVAAYYPRRYVPGGALWALVAATRLGPGLLIKAAFDRISADRPPNDVLVVLAVLGLIHVGRAAIQWAATLAWPRWFNTVAAWLRANLLHSVLCEDAPPSVVLPSTAGEAIGRFRDDVDDLIWLADVWVDLTGDLVVGVVGITIMAAINPLFTAVVFVPLALTVVLVQQLSARLRRIHRGMRQSGAAVTAFVADSFTNVLALKAAGAEGRATTQLHALNAARGDAAVRSDVALTLLSNVGGATADISIGVVLVLAASALRRGSFTVGDLALFTAYSSALVYLPRRIGLTLARSRTAGVSTDRLARLMPDEDANAIFAPTQVFLKSAVPAPTPPSRDADDTLVALCVRGLTASPAPGRRGVVDVDLDVAAGELVVITGSIGSGKTTLLRGLLGLIPIESGTITWNGTEVTRPSRVLVPPRAAYVAQVPRLFSATLEENVRFGWPADDDAVHAALGAAVVDEDIAEMPDGLATLVGPRGMRLSGGQAQRTAAARALVRQPELLVVDDLSSALDPSTETRLWDALRARSGACLAVSHRPGLLEIADRVIVLEAGRVVAKPRVSPFARARLLSCDE